MTKRQLARKSKVGVVTLKRWSSLGLIPGPSGRGTAASWPDDAIHQARVADWLIGGASGERWTQEAVARVRRWAVLALAAGKIAAGFPERQGFAGFMHEVHENDPALYGAIFRWLTLLGKSRNGLKLAEPASFALSFAVAKETFAPIPAEKWTLGGRAEKRERIVCA